MQKWIIVFLILLLSDKIEGNKDMRTIKKLHKATLFRVSIVIASIMGLFFSYTLKEKNTNPLANDAVNLLVTPAFGEGGDGGCEGGDGAGCEGGGAGDAGSGSGGVGGEYTPPPPPPPSVQVNFN